MEDMNEQTSQFFIFQIGKSLNFSPCAISQLKIALLELLLGLQWGKGGTGGAVAVGWAEHPLQFNSSLPITITSLYWLLDLLGNCCFTWRLQSGSSASLFWKQQLPTFGQQNDVLLYLLILLFPALTDNGHRRRRILKVSQSVSEYQCGRKQSTMQSQAFKNAENYTTVRMTTIPKTPSTS